MVVPFCSSSNTSAVGCFEINAMLNIKKQGPNYKLASVDLHDLNK